MSAVLHFAWLWEVSWLIGWRCLVYVCKRTVHGRVLMCDFFHIPVAFLFACSDLYLCGLYMIVPVLCWILCFWGIFDTKDIVWVGCDLRDCPFIHKFVFILRYCHKSCKEWPLALSCPSVDPSTGKHLASHWMIFLEIIYSGFLVKYIKKIWVWLKVDQNTTFMIFHHEHYS